MLRAHQHFISVQLDRLIEDYSYESVELYRASPGKVEESRDKYLHKIILSN